MEGTFCENATDKGPFVNLMELGKHIFQGFVQNGHHRMMHGMMRPKMLKFTIAQLHQNGLLNAKSMAALIVSTLPDFISLVATHPEKINGKFYKKLPALEPLLQDLKVLLSNTKG